ncbi:uncharacterized protein LOC144712836 [Wolffia australiana]
MVQISSSPSVSCGSRDEGFRFANLRGVQWRMNLGILPSSSDASVDDFRRVTADSRRRYAILRRQLLMDPKFDKDGARSRDLTMDNPLSQNPDSTWGRFFHNAELEKLVEQDLSRLYPEEGSFFQNQPCQAMLRRILLSWCLQHPEYGYRQGMHELMAPFIYVLNEDVQLLSQVRRQYEDHFNDEFDGRSFKYKTRKNSAWDEREVEEEEEGPQELSNGTELDDQTRDTILLNDAYGAEGELGIVLSERFMEHDTYCMFDALMKGAQGVVAIADFFSPYPLTGSSSGLSPVIEASSAVYQLLSAVDSVLHCHLQDLGVEPQYFALRWLRVLFGREFKLQDLLIIWDEIFSSSNGQEQSHDLSQANFKILSCPRGAFIAGLAASMILRLRSSLLAAENATICLQRLLNFPDKVDLKKLIEKARSLQDLAMDLNFRALLELPLEMNGSGPARKSSTHHARRYSVSSGSLSPATPHRPPPDSYWEEKWRVIHRNSEDVNGGRSPATPLLKTQSDISPLKSLVGEKASFSAVRRRLFEDSSTSPKTQTSPKLAGGREEDEKEEVFLPVVQGGEEGKKAEEEGKKKGRAALPSTFQWLWRLGRDGGESAAENANGDAAEAMATGESSDRSSSSVEFRNGDTGVMVSLKDLGQAVMDNVQVLESAFQAEGDGQAAAMAALEELRKISQRLVEM